MAAETVMLRNINCIVVVGVGELGCDINASSPELAAGIAVACTPMVKHSKCSSASAIRP